MLTLKEKELKHVLNTWEKCRPQAFGLTNFQHIPKTTEVLKTVLWSLVNKASTNMYEGFFMVLDQFADDYLMLFCNSETLIGDEYAVKQRTVESGRVQQGNFNRESYK